MANVRLLLSMTMLAALLTVGARGVGSAPPLGPLLEPVHGAWAVARTAGLPLAASAVVPTLGDSVHVVHDTRGVPHIFGSSYEDVIRALGFVVARDRLVQLDLQTRATAGTLSELLGAGLLEVDRSQRALGLAWSAEREWNALDSDDPSARVARAFATGANAWIDQIDWRTLPLEYRLLNAWPMRWEPVHSLYLSRRMGYTLTYSTSEYRRRRAMELIGREATDALFGRHATIREPIQPGPRASYPWFDTSPLPPPGTPSRPDGDRRAARPREVSTGAVLALGWLTPSAGDPPGDVIGSNNWAVAPERSASGHTLLAGDPHLDLSLPSIWYEAHLVVPGELDVYGVTIPGFPGLVIGFNRDIAWTFTNTGADVLDYYREELDDEGSPTQYRVDGEWRDLTIRVEEYRNRRGRLIATDTVYHTHRGPVRWDNGYPLSLRWTNLESSTSATVLRSIATATTVAEFFAATEAWSPSAQNMLVADRSGAIAIRSTGLFPYRGALDGADFLDGTTSQHDWTGYWPVEQYPTGLRPAQGYLASANQEPLDPLDDSTYFGVEWPSPWRAMRINRLLRTDSAVTVDAVRRYQTDPGNEKAELFVPMFLEAASVDGAAAHGAKQTSLELAATLLSSWDRQYTRDNTVAVLFEMAMDDLEDLVWDELAPPTEHGEPRSTRRRVATPGEQMLWRALQDSSGVWCDVHRTQILETCRGILARSLASAYERAVARFGESERDAWRWDRNQSINIWHLLRLPSFSALGLPVQGGPGNLNPASGRGAHGASWRMVVELGDEVRAWATYPGGQSGNPTSPFYDDRIAGWIAGQLDPVLFPRSRAGLDEGWVAARLSLSPGGGER